MKHKTWIVSGTNCTVNISEIPNQTIYLLPHPTCDYFADSVTIANAQVRVFLNSNLTEIVSLTVKPWPQSLKALRGWSTSTQMVTERGRIPFMLEFSFLKCVLFTPFGNSIPTLNCHIWAGGHCLICCESRLLLTTCRGVSVWAYNAKSELMQVGEYKEAFEWVSGVVLPIQTKRTYFPNIRISHVHYWTNWIIDPNWRCPSRYWTKTPPNRDKSESSLTAHLEIIPVGLLQPSYHSFPAINRALAKVTQMFFYALEKVNGDPQILPNHHIVVLWEHTDDVCTFFFFWIPRCN